MKFVASKGLRFEVTEFSVDEVNGPTEAEVAIGVEADLAIFDGPTLIMREPAFEVLLLARELNRWLATAERSAFIADLGSVRENVGAIRIIETSAGWVISTDLSERQSRPFDLPSVEGAARRLIASVEERVVAAGYDPRLSTPDEK